MPNLNEYREWRISVFYDNSNHSSEQVFFGTFQEAKAIAMKEAIVRFGEHRLKTQDKEHPQIWLDAFAVAASITGVECAMKTGSEFSVLMAQLQEAGLLDDVNSPCYQMVLQAIAARDWIQDTTDSLVHKMGHYSEWLKK